MTKATLRRENIGAGLQLRGLVHYHHGGEHGSMQAAMVLEKALRVLHVDLQAAEGACEPTGQSLGIGALKARPHHDTLPPTRPYILTVAHPMAKHLNS